MKNLEEMTDRDLDEWLAIRVMKLNAVGYYRRISENTTDHELCTKDEVSPDDDSLTVAGLYYKPFDDNPFVKTDQLHAVPFYTQQIESALVLLFKIKETDACSFVISSMENGKWGVYVHIFGPKMPIDSFFKELSEANDPIPSRAICKAVYLAVNNMTRRQDM